ncbi:MAG: IclR family transcriptional regulator [Deltaproteobacteria bacterium]|nr:IclR family transcriptional regulator [Deltaproteobacteria bacterium]
MVDDIRPDFKRVPAVDKCFAVLDLFASSKGALKISDVSGALGLNKSTVFNLLYTLTDLDILEYGPERRFRFGVRLYTLGKAAGRGSSMISVVHPYLREINEKTLLSSFLGIRSGRRAIIVDKVDTAFEIKIYSEVGMSLPLLAGAGGQALLSLLPGPEVDRILVEEKLKKYTSLSCTDPRQYREKVSRVKDEGIAFDNEEYIEGMCAFAVPLRIGRADLQAAIWAVGIKGQFNGNVRGEHAGFLKQIAEKVRSRLSID